MTIAICVKVYDGIVLATDSATTVVLPNGGTQVYNNADKIFQLHRGLPVGAMTWGLGHIGAASISTLAKDLRRRLMGQDPLFSEWCLDPSVYTVEEVAQHLADMFHDLFKTNYSTSPAVGGLGVLVVGYSATAKQSEAWLVQLEDPTVYPTPTLVAGEQDSGWLAYAQPEATARLFNGFDPALPAMVAQIAPGTDQAGVQAVLQPLLQRTAVVPMMPFPDAIAFARYLVDVTVGYSHFLLGPDTVGGPVEVAGLNRHENFKWISRKHYFSTALNREDPGHV